MTFKEYNFGSKKLVDCKIMPVIAYVEFEPYELGDGRVVFFGKHYYQIHVNGLDLLFVPITITKNKEKEIVTWDFNDVNFDLPQKEELFESTMMGKQSRVIYKKITKIKYVSKISELKKVIEFKKIDDIIYSCIPIMRSYVNKLENIQTGEQYELRPLLISQRFG